MTPQDVMKMVQEQGSQVRRLPLHRYPWQGTARRRAGFRLRHGQVRGRPRLRRLLDRRLEGHSGLRHAVDARSRHRLHRSLHGRNHAGPVLRRGRAGRRQGLRPRPALDRQARRGLSEVLRHRRHRLLRPRTRILHLRLRRVEGRHVRLLLQGRSPKRPPGPPADKFEGGNTGHRPTVKGGYFPVPPVDSLQRHPRRHVSGAGRLRRAGRSASPRSRHRRPVRNRHHVQHPGAAAPTRPRC